MKHISIPQPCSENFNLMTPTERGAFCSKCATDTFDFRDKSTQEIKQIFHQHAGEKICGRMNHQQIEALNLEFEQWSFRSEKSFQSMFLFCLLVVFGLTLFSCSDKSGQQHIESLSVLGIVPPIVPEEHDKMQRPEIEQTEQNQHPQPIRMWDEDSCDYWYAGEPVRSEGFNKFIAETVVDTTTTETRTSNEIAEVITLDGTLYPNPTINSSKLDLTIPETDYFVIDVYSTGGYLVDNIHEGTLEQGTFQAEIPLFGVVPGMYLVVVRSSKESKTFRVEKM